MDQEQLDKRLDKIEDKIDKLSESMVMLARAEEKLISMETDRKMLWDKLHDIEGEMEDSKNVIGEYRNATQTTNRLMWIIITATVTALGAWAIQLLTT